MFFKESLLAKTLALLLISNEPQAKPLASFCTDSRSQGKAEEGLTVRKVFHIAGIPTVARNTRGDIILTSKDLIFQKGKKQPLRVPFGRLDRLQVLSGERNYPGATYVAAVSTALTMGVAAGAFLILKKRKVDTLIFEYTNERGGHMGAVLQASQGEGKRLGEWLLQFGIRVEEPSPIPGSPSPEKNPAKPKGDPK